jgi:hypothetical protein
LAQADLATKITSHNLSMAAHVYNSSHTFIKIFTK